MNENMRYTAIVLAAGSGSRMHSEVPKQYLPLAGHPLLSYSLRAFEDSSVDSVVLVAAPDMLSRCRALVGQYGLKKVEAVISGGGERYLSVYEGLQAAADADYVLIHDGARPFPAREQIEASMQAVAKEQACVLAVPVKDTIKIADADGYACRTPDRSTLWAVQTPQSFYRPLLMEAYEKLFRMPQEQRPQITDDAMLVERMLGKRVRIVLGDYGNIKVTTPEDLPIAETMLRAAGYNFAL